MIGKWASGLGPELPVSLDPAIGDSNNLEYILTTFASLRWLAFSPREEVKIIRAQAIPN